jgi:hypothetical protein
MTEFVGGGKSAFVEMPGAASQTPLPTLPLRVESRIVSVPFWLGSLLVKKMAAPNSLAVWFVIVVPQIVTIGVSNCIAWRHPEYPSTGD